MGWTIRLPHLEDRLEDGEGNWGQKDGGPALAEIQRDGGVCFPAAAAIGLRLVQELRGSVPGSFHGRERCCDAWQGGVLRAEARCCWRRKEEVSGSRLMPGRVPACTGCTMASSRGGRWE